MNNKPVAWMDSYGNICLDIDKRMNQGKITAKYNYDSCDIPLYTHPVKELTDEEIMECFKEVNLFTANMVDVTRAILRKAQEK